MNKTSEATIVFLYNGYGLLRFYPGIENLILHMLSDPGCHVRAVHWFHRNSRSWSSSDCHMRAVHLVVLELTCMVVKWRHCLVSEYFGHSCSSFIIKFNGEQEKQSIICVRVCCQTVIFLSPPHIYDIFV